MRTLNVEMIVTPKTPKQIRKGVKLLLSALKITDAKPVYLSFTHRSDTYLNSFCFKNCEDEKKKTGCEIIYGWSLWEDKKLGFYEAEFHSVIKDNGDLIDITPRQKNEDSILFVSDMSKTSGRKSVNSWHSWSNCKIVNGHVAEVSVELEIVQADGELSEFRTAHAIAGKKLIVKRSER